MYIINILCGIIKDPRCRTCRRRRDEYERKRFYTTPLYYIILIIVYYYVVSKPFKKNELRRTRVWRDS